MKFIEQIFLCCINFQVTGLSLFICKCAELHLECSADGLRLKVSLLKFRDGLRLKVSLLKFRAVVLYFALLAPLRILDSLVTAPKLPSTFTLAISCSFFVSMRPSKPPSLLHLLCWPLEHLCQEAVISGL